MRFIASSVLMLLTLASAKGQGPDYSAFNEFSETHIPLMDSRGQIMQVPQLPQLKQLKRIDPAAQIKAIESIEWLPQPKQPYYLDPTFLEKDFNQKTYKFGGDSSGGGNSILVSGFSQRMLLDFYASKRTGLLQQVSGQQAVISKEKIALTNMQTYSVLIPREQPAYQILRMRLQRWENLLPGFTETIVQIAHEMFFYINDDYVTNQERYFLTPEDRVQVNEIKTIASYQRSLRGAIISRRIWERMDLDSQAGLLLHEVLRHIQILEESTGDFKSFTDEDLQIAVSVLILEEPSENSKTLVLQRLARSSHLLAKYYVVNSEEKAKRLQGYCGYIELMKQKISSLKNVCISEEQKEVDYYYQQLVQLNSQLAELNKTLNPVQLQSLRIFENYIRTRYVSFAALVTKARIPPKNYLDMHFDGVDAFTSSIERNQH